MSLRGILTNVMASKVEISYRTILFAFALVAGLWLVLQIRDILFLLFIAFLLMTALHPLVYSGEVPVAAFYCDWPCILGHIRIPGSIVCRRHTGFGGAVHQIYEGTPHGRQPRIAVLEYRCGCTHVTDCSHR